MQTATFRQLEIHQKQITEVFMNNNLRNVFTLTLLMLAFAVANTAAQTRAYTASDSQVQTLLNRIETQTDTFRRNIAEALDRSSLNNTNSEDMLMNYITEFENSTDALKQRFEARRSVDNDVQDVLNRAANINQFMANNRLTNKVQTNWTALRNDINTLARYYNVSWNWNSTVNNDYNSNTRPYRVTDASVQTLLNRIETNTDKYRRSLERALDRSRLNNTNTEDNIAQFISDFENQTDELKRKFDARSSVGTDVSDLLSRASYIERFMRNNRLNTAAQRDWQTLRNDLNTLSNYYNVSWNWNTLPTNNNQNSRMDLNGTYRLNASLSDNVSTVVGNSVKKYYSGNQRDRVRQNLERRLSPPNMLAIERIGQQFTIGSDLSQQISFAADGVSRTETNENGRNVKITTNTTSDNGVMINYEGDRMNDFYVSFMPMSNGQMKVMRRVYLENRNETVTVTSVYDKISPTAQWSQVNYQDNISNNSYDQFVIPNNTQLTAVLENIVSTKVSQDGDRFRMRVTSPSQYDGAIIEGRVTKAERSGRVSGRANVSLEFDTIRLRNGQTYRFAGIVDGVKNASGENVTVNNEGSVRDNNQTSKTVKRGAIGASIGAIIGAIAGGGKGAAIGAVIGGGAGAGTVLIQGKDDVELDSGSEFRITATAPNNLSSNR